MNGISFPQNMEVFPPTSSFKRDEFRDELTGEQNFEYILIPRLAGKFQLNPITLTYFDPDVEQFITTRSKAEGITVYPGDKSEIASTKFNRQDISMIGEDIRYIRSRNPSWYNIGKQYIPIWAWGTYLIAGILFVFPGMFSKVKANRSSTASFRQSRSALRLALKNLSKPADDPFAYTALVMYRYFQSKLFLSSDNLDPFILELALKDKVHKSLLLEAVSLAKICDAGRYGPEAGKAEETLQKEVCELLKKIDKEIV